MADPEILNGAKCNVRISPVADLSQMQIMNYTRFVLKKATYWKKCL